MHVSFWTFSWLRMSYQYSNIQPMLLLIDVELRLPAVSHITRWSCSSVVAFVAVVQLVFFFYEVYVVEIGAIQKLNVFSNMCDICIWSRKKCLLHLNTCSPMNIYIRISVVVPSFWVQHSLPPTSFQLNVAPLFQFAFICTDAQC